MFFFCSKSSNFYRNIHSAGESDDNNQLKESEEVSLGGEGGEEEAEEGDAGEVGGGQGEQAEKQLHCSRHSRRYLDQSFFLVFAE